MSTENQILEKLGNELVGLWVECKTRSEKIEDIAKELKLLRR